MDVLAEHDSVICEQVFFAVAGHLGLESDVLLLDTTSTYFATEDDDEFRRCVNSKDHHPEGSKPCCCLAFVDGSQMTKSASCQSPAALR